MGLTKQRVRRAQGLTLDDYLVAEAHGFALASASDDYRIGRDAFRAGTVAEFRGQ
jgi:hypothetical protein